jgi:hypothetical protein
MESFSAHLDMLVGRWDGPLAFRIMIQPAVAAFLGIRAGLRDARAVRPAYGWTVTTDPSQRRNLIREGWKDVWKLFTAAVIVDLICQVIELDWIYPGQALIIAALLALPSYFLIRGLANRTARLWLLSRSLRPQAFPQERAMRMTANAEPATARPDTATRVRANRAAQGSGFYFRAPGRQIAQSADAVSGAAGFTSRRAIARRAQSLHRPLRRTRLVIAHGPP